jgi:hypothetical protein
MPPNVSQAPNRKNNPHCDMRSTALLRKLQATGKTHRFASSLNRPKAAGNLPASTMLMNDLHTWKNELAAAIQ